MSHLSAVFPLNGIPSRLPDTTSCSSSTTPPSTPTHTHPTLSPILLYKLSRNSSLKVDSGGGGFVLVIEMRPVECGWQVNQPTSRGNSSYESSCPPPPILPEEEWEVLEYITPFTHGS
ncbi:hypothetical protein Pmani_029170 [Petrolisthes manimaculis]|uniref:Uncharacterized protein n=1 Tax=Petrolisthes manimaculis TaxID=1843537 RepID=A0AAE1P0R9_9EUCA|nr:hypothetical protein Pmani_029170 [Petrolisthes manimaculis]